MTELFETGDINARSAYIEKSFSRLNEMQKSAVTATEGPLLILAGAGTGKTTVLINRIAMLLLCGGAGMRVEPWQIIAITFTNKAAGELKTRLEALLGASAAGIWAHTFHSACVRILRRDADRLGYGKNFTIYDAEDSRSAVKKILKSTDTDETVFPPKSVLSEISRAKDSFLPAAEYLERAEQTGDIRKIRTGEIYKEYSELLKEANAMDFDDLIMNAVKLLAEHEDLREYYRNKFKYVLVDEYQDTNKLQYLLACELAGGHGNICVVGDDDQSIYKFRGAVVENILNFENEFKNARVIKLEQNYRSTGKILDAANAVIGNNTSRKGKTLWTKQDPGDKIVLYTAGDENEEARFIAAKIKDAAASGGNWRDNAVLYRMNAQSNRIEYAFKQSGIPYRIIGGTRFFDRAEIKDMLSYLSVLQTPSDDLRLLRIINTPARGIGRATIEAAAEIAEERGLSLFETVKNAGEYPELKRCAEKLSRFTEMIEKLAESAKILPLDELYDELIEKTGYIAALDEKGSEENKAKAENVRELKSSMIARKIGAGDDSLAGFLDEVALYTDTDNYDRDADCAVMMTIHSAKGLEFDTVFIAGAEEGVFPGLRAVGEKDEMEEERRLCYVAMTRAMRRLFITSAERRTLFGLTTANRLSRFVEEIPDEHIEKPLLLSAKKQIYEFSPKISDKAFVRRPARSEQKKEILVFDTGDRVIHKAFGKGTIVSMTPMGGDSLIEIEFDEAGKKRLMLRAAGENMIRE
ncbi:MAG: UvrD-helicase domain-containing protein [Oscillospiraceae bacterium]|nr:UvrD-helicase domain-containing protein [Oscillospiraceae bacterium]